MLFFLTMANHNIIRLTESDLRNMIACCVEKYIQECDGSAFGGGASGCDNLMVGTPDESGDVIYPFGDVQRKSIHKPKDKNRKQSNVDMSDALKRHDGKGGSISINNK